MAASITTGMSSQQPQKKPRETHNGIVRQNVLAAFLSLSSTHSSPAQLMFWLWHVSTFRQMLKFVSNFPHNHLYDLERMI